MPIIIAALIAGAFLLPTSRDPEQGALDPPGALLSIVGLGALVYAIIEAPDHGWASAETLLWFAVAAVVLAALPGLGAARRAIRCSNLHLFHDRRFSVASGGMTLMFFAMFGIFFLLTQYFQLVLGYDAAEGRPGPAPRSPSPS